MVGLGLVAFALVKPDSAFLTVVVGLGPKAAIVGLFFVVRPLAGRLRKRLPPWLPW